MIYKLTEWIKFPASHVLADHPLCGKLHGHTYKVEVTIVGDPDPEMNNMIANDRDLLSAIANVIFEISGRHLNDQLPAIIPSAQGIANWVWERLALRFQLHEVTVWQDDLRASISRE